jgi:hypothetical protein
MRRPKNLGTAGTGIHHVAKVANQANCIFELVGQENDVGIDAWIELVVDQEVTGCWVALQVKSGSSYCPASGWIIPADAAHLKYWRSHSLPVCGVVFDPRADVARWVNISAFLSDNPTLNKACDIPVPPGNRFDVESFAIFRHHFLDCREQFSDDAHFGRSLRQFSHLDDPEACDSALRALFSFHRDRPETWYFIVTSLPCFRDHPLIQRLAVLLCHVPGHGDIFWHSKNIIPEPACAEAMSILRRFLSRDGVISLLGAVDASGIGRGTVGQCVCAVVLVVPHRAQLLESIIFDPGLSEDLRFWAVLMLIYTEQRRDIDHLMRTLDATKAVFQDENLERIAGLSHDLKTCRFIDFS